MASVCQGQVHLALCLYNVGNSRAERDQNLNAKEGAFGRGKVEASQCFRKKSVSTVDMEPPPWIHTCFTHAQISHLHGLAPKDVSSTSFHIRILGGMNPVGF